ncbi:MAG TPA: ABC transporter permease [Candidatus Acidoferrales bacterium]|nr:ABC transporter permease [Candidatus Acidoferrales bacterium]
MGSLLQDVRYGMRMLAKNPGFTVIAVLTLALGIGANTAIFSVVDSVLLRPLPDQHPESLVQISNAYLPAWPRLGLSPGDFEDWRQQASSFSEMAAYADVAQGFNLTGAGEPERVQADFATSNLFPMLGIRPLFGRAFEPNEDKPARAPALMLTQRLWETRFGSDPGVVGQTIILDGKGFTVVGILPASLKLTSRADIWLAAGQYQDDLTGRVHHPYTTIARLRHGVSISEAQTELATLNQQAELTYPDTHKGWGIVVQQMENPDAANLRMALLVLFGAVALVLLIACANIVNLLLARNAARQKEIALRVALGAGRLRLTRQLLTESLLLSVAGGILGILLAIAALRLMHALVPANLLSVNESGLDVRVLAFTIVTCFLAGIVSGLAPAFHALKTNLNDVLKEGSRSFGTSSDQKLRNLLVVSEIALALIPLVGAGLLIRSFHRLLEVDPGFRPEHIFTMRVSQPAMADVEFNKLTPEQQTNLPRKQSLEFQQVADQIESIPGVQRVGGIDVLPLASATVQATRFFVEGQPTPGGARPVTELRTASLGYFSAMGIPLVSGRLFTEEDWIGSNIVINVTMAKRFWADSSPIGKRVNLCTLAPKPCWSPIIGVVGDVHEYGLDAAPTFDTYAAGGWTPYFVIRTAGDPALMARAAAGQVHKTFPELPVTDMMTLDNLLSDSVSPRRFSTALLGIFAALALVLAAVGIYGVMSYVVNLRTNEIGIRMALGAQTGDIWSLIIGRGAKLALAGVALGLAGASALSRFLSSLLYGVQSTDPITFFGVAFLLLAVALAACYIPTRRAMRVDPMVALRYE